jgi:chromosome segregation ATPase
MSSISKMLFQKYKNTEYLNSSKIQSEIAESLSPEEKQCYKIFLSHYKSHDKIHTEKRRMGQQVKNKIVRIYKKTEELFDEYKEQEKQRKKEKEQLEEQQQKKRQRIEERKQERVSIMSELNEITDEFNKMNIQIKELNTLNRQCHDQYNNQFKKVEWLINELNQMGGDYYLLYNYVDTLNTFMEEYNELYTRMNVFQEKIKHYYEPVQTQQPQAQQAQQPQAQQAQQPQNQIVRNVPFWSL